MSSPEQQYAARCIELVHDLATIETPERASLERLLETRFRPQPPNSAEEFLGAPTELFATIRLSLYPQGGGVLNLGPPEGVLIEPSLLLQRTAFGPQIKYLRDLYAPDGGASNTFFALEHIRLCVETGYSVQFLRRFSLEWRRGG